MGPNEKLEPTLMCRQQQQPLRPFTVFLEVGAGVPVGQRL